MREGPKRRVRPSTALLACVTVALTGGSPGAQQPSPAHFDVLIEGGRVIDGTGNPWFYADVGVTDGTVTAVGDLGGTTADRRIDARGRFVAPGFIDLHSHADGHQANGLRSEDAQRRAAPNLVAQGITTVVVNQDGRSPTSIVEQRAQLATTPFGPNAVLLVGHNTVRALAMGGDPEALFAPSEIATMRRAATPDEIATMRRLVQEGMEAGAYGLSAGLEYVPGRWSNTDELVAIVEEIAPRRGVYIVHERSSGAEPMWYLPSHGDPDQPTFLDSIAEAIEVGERTGATVVATHAKARGANYWGSSHAAIQLIERARARGVDVWADHYPYNTTGSDGNTRLIPAWIAGAEFESFAGDEAGANWAYAVLKVLENPSREKRLRADIAHEIARRGGAENIVVMAFPDARLVGQTLAEIAKTRDLDPVELAIRLQLEGAEDRRGGVTLRGYSLSEIDVDAYAAQTWMATASDAGIALAGDGLVHARYYGTFPRKIRRYARERGVLSVEDAIRSMTSLPAQILGFRNRGQIREGFHADIVVMDLDTLRDRATFADPHQLPDGIEHVLVNGEAVIDGGELTGAFGGLVITPEDGRRPPASATTRDTVAAADDIPNTPPSRPSSPDGGNGGPPPMASEVMSRDDRGQVTIRATRVPEPIVLDGLLEEGIYRTVASIESFVQQVPREGEPASDRTEVWVFFDDTNVYFSARCWDEQPDQIVANELRRDNIGIYFNDNFAVALDTFHDRRNAYLFQTNALGGIGDGYITDERVHDRDWNSVWRTRSRRFSDGWTVEMAIPFKSLRFGQGPAQVWGVNFRRINQKKNEHAFVTRIPASLGGRGIYKMSSAATLVGVETPSGAKNLEFKPYALSTLTTDLTAEPAFSDDLNGDVGFDVKYGVTRSLTLDLTYNTDFAQVEADEQQVNLTRFSLFFPEKREFFLEGQGIFAFGDPGGLRGGGGGFGFRPPSNTPVLFFSRRIGLTDGQTVPIIAGGRLSGRAGKYSIGALGIRTGESDLVESRDTNFTVLRVKRDILRRSNIGVLATHRSVGKELSGTNQALGVDANLSFFQDLRIDGYYAFTRTTDLSGDDTTYSAGLDYAGDKYGVQVNHLTVEENFNPEVGFLRRTDFRRNFAQARYSPRPQAIRAIRKIGFEPSFEHIADNAGRLETRQANFSTRIEFDSGDRWNISYRDNFEYLDEDFEIADGIFIPPGEYSFRDATTTYRLGGQRKVSGAFTFLRGDFFSGERTQVSYRGRVEISTRFSVEPNLSLNFVDLPEGSFTARLYSARATFTATARMFVGALVQYNSSNDSLNSNVRLRWEYEPGSDLFVVYSDGRLVEDGGSSFSMLENRSVAVKLTRLVRF